MYCHLLNGRMSLDRNLHLVTRNVLASPLEIVLLAVDEIEKAFLVEPAYVPGVEPLVAHRRHRRLRPAPVPLEHDVRAVGANDHLAGHVHRYLPFVLIDDADVERSAAFAGGSRSSECAARQPGDQCRFRHAVIVRTHVDRPEPTSPGFLDCVAEGHSAHGVHLSEALPRPVGVRRLGDQGRDRPHQGHYGCAAAMHFRPEVRKGKPRRDCNSPSTQHRGRDPGGEGVVVKERQGRIGNVVGGRGICSEPLGREVAEVVVALHAAFGGARRTRRIDDAGRVRGLGGDLDRRVVRPPVHIQWFDRYLAGSD